jgi:signal peptidase I
LYEAWWATWKTEKLIDYVPQPRRWSKTTYVPQRGDIVVFPREEIKAIMGETPWRIGRITHTDIGKDGKVRVAIIEYRNPKEKVFRQTRRSVRTLAVLHKEGNLELLERLNEASKVANLHFIRTEPELHYLGNTAKA